MKLKYQAALLTAALAMASCSSDDLFGEADGKLGSVYKPGVEVNNVEKVVKDGSGTSRATYDISNYIVEFCRQGETTPVSTYVYRDMPGAVELPEGAYTVSVRSHDVQKADYVPYFAGVSEAFNVVAGDFTEVKPIKCTFQSIKVSIVFDQDLLDASSDIKVVAVANDEGKLEFTPQKNAPGYFEALPGSTTMVLTFTGMVNGTEENFTKTFDDLEAGQHRIVTFRLGAKGPEPDQPHGGVGGTGINVDLTYTDEDLTGDVNPGQEDVINDGEDTPGTLPEIKDPENPDDPNNPGKDPENPDDPEKPGDAITFTGNLVDGGHYTTTSLSTYDVLITVPAGIEDLVVKIDCPEGGLTKDTLTDVGLDNEFSLVTSEEFFPALSNPEGINFPVGDDVKGKTSMTFDITGFMGILGILDPSDNTFTLTVTDANGEVKSMSFTITVE